jgi:hypothetical protein
MSTRRIAARTATGAMALVLGLGVGAWSQGGQAPADHAAPAAKDRPVTSIFPVTGKPLPGPLPAPVHQAHKHATAVHQPAPANAPTSTPGMPGTPGPSSPAPQPHMSATVPMTRTTGGQFGGGTQNPCNTPAGAGLGDCMPGGGAHPAPTQAPDGTPAQNACARSLAAGHDSCANAPANAPGLGLPPNEAPSAG